ncbi:1-acyl-sn-glycerol-3-phosphate acyltransferase [Chlamydia muridarum str. Nigg]|jgi:1-acyl-sn-glycerol-3-phosphate acyltransferase|uniref:Acyl-phosphate glycerol 3-phosphate acyltransferase n=2 Tax=Chlamydia muridarum TaxID=83560 RepID=A0A070A013_CHLMR|nr:lysophospholipid acyltransferase family protein [Chlamydia muridarum]AAF73599.1 1-acyl-sn-glycerol-3-phosphate acyltransferase, putative [Chlamydia muridarum str. Nigg]AHH23124.1 1-acyl-sn-glycerol-3-phosphate acyltransferase [Chlamydia muridarum str. Nigg3 CMUT3-5]AHH24049.1 1-acyl-sn-glycerol-3-phosphate acyltransferase [Chlamydia muridarum str. Nigg CM972]AID38253.1 acyl-phosphate glycerol 3-phosphate acyltransferase [Chlamydia muridarum str. Nigg 2 MCR]AIT90896.1 acyl-phosphate glycerol
MIFTIAKSLVRLLFPLFYRRKIFRSKASASVTGAAIIAANHVSFLDPIIIPLSFPGKIYHLAKSGLFANSFAHWLFHELGCYPISRNAGNSAAFKAALNIFSRGEKLIIYPEGTRHSDGEIHQGKVGVGMLALKGNVPVIPVYVAGTLEAFGKHQKFPKLWKTLTTVIGTPISFQDLIDNPAIDKKEAYQLATERIMAKIAKLRTWFQQGCIGEIP